MRAGLLMFAAAALVVGFASTGYAATSQQDKMTACNGQAGKQNLSGDARKQFMSSCLSGGAAMPAAASNKTSACNTQADAKKLSGAARTSFVKKCAAG